MTKSVGSGNISLRYESEGHRGPLLQIAQKLMSGGQIDSLVSQKRIAEADAALAEVDSLTAQLSRDPLYRSCCEPFNNGVITPARNNAFNKIRSTERQAAVESERKEQAAAFSQGLQTLMSGGQSIFDASRERSASYQPVILQQTSNGSSLWLILGITGGLAGILLLVLLLRR